MAVRDSAPLTGVSCAGCKLRRLPAFVPNTPDEIGFIQSLKVSELAVSAQAIIVPLSQTSDRLYTLLSGWAFRFKMLPDGRRQILNFLLPGDLLGLQARLFAESDHGIEALTDVVLCVFARERVWAIFRDHPRIAFDITWLGAREEALVDDGLLSAGRRTAAERLAALFLQLYGRAAAVGLQQGDAVAMPLTQAHIADALGLSAVHLNRTLQRLRRLGLVEFGGGVLRLPNQPALRQLAGDTGAATAARPLI